MSSTAKISISIPDEGLLKWAKSRSEKTGMSLSSVFTEAVRFERQMEARRALLAEMGADAVPTPEEAAKIRAELGLDTVSAKAPRERKGQAGLASAKRSRGGAGLKR
jgi:hypothetical protein